MADYRSLEIKVRFARDLKNVNLVSKMDPYVVVSLSCDPKSTHKTPVDRTGNKNPTWNSDVKFAVDVAAAQRVRPTFVFSILCERALGDKPIGYVHVPLADLLGSVEGGKLCHVAYQVRKPSGRAKGELNFSYQWGEKLSVASPLATAPPLPTPSAPPLPQGKVEGTSSGFYPPVAGYNMSPPAVGKVQETVTAYPVVSGYGPYGPYQPPPYGGYQHQYPPIAGYGNGGYSPAHQYGGYPQPHGPSYGYQAQPGYVYPPVRPSPRRNNNNNNGLLGIGAGVLGGLLVGDLLFG